MTAPSRLRTRRASRSSDSRWVSSRSTTTRPRSRPCSTSANSSMRRASCAPSGRDIRTNPASSGGRLRPAAGAPSAACAPSRLSSRQPRAASAVRPRIVVAARFIERTRPSASSTTTPSPIAARVAVVAIASRWADSRARCRLLLIRLPAAPLMASSSSCRCSTVPGSRASMPCQYIDCAVISSATAVLSRPGPQPPNRADTKIAGTNTSSRPVSAPTASSTRARSTPTVAVSSRASR